MTGLCEGGNEPSGSLKAICKVFRQTGLHATGIDEEVTEKINLVPSYVGEKVSEKLKSVLQKNPGLTVVRTVAGILAEKTPEHECAVPLYLIPTFKCALVSSVDVERSFSAYKMMLSEKRCSFSMENLEKMLVVYSGSNYGHVQ
ncbi:hypothetical protein ANN_20629 [Periplaneta americana]|uniref:HAT C-terminal dimerisation domain-containing protein n=1 Tax=Periplaneta americana TaxID=6978 RepID=A0ABQ8SE99_PERAM|nr:hypothetical protein ANN_20629 [Periplaneta americana]